MRAVVRSAARSAALLPALLWLAGAAAAASPFAGSTATAVDDAALARVRGGFSAPGSGLHVSFGVQRAVSIDGSRAAATASAGGVTLIQRGGGNSFATDGLSAVAAATVLQNTLDNQQIQLVTTIDVQTDSLRVSRGLALQSAVGLGIAASLRR